MSKNKTKQTKLICKNIISKNYKAKKIKYNNDELITLKQYINNMHTEQYKLYSTILTEMCIDTSLVIMHQHSCVINSNTIN